MPRKRNRISDSDSESDTESRSEVTVTKRSLCKAIDLVLEGESDNRRRNVDFGGRKAVRECQLPSLRALDLCSVADVFSPESSTTKVLEVLRISLLTAELRTAARLLGQLLQSATKPLLPLMWKTAVVLFCSSKISNEKILDDFLELCAMQRSSEDKQRLVQTLTTLPDILDSKRASQPTIHMDDVDDPGIIIVSDDEDDLSIEP